MFDRGGLAFREAGCIENWPVIWCPRRDSNPEPTDYESAALTVELQGHTKVKKWTGNCEP